MKHITFSLLTCLLSIYVAGPTLADPHMTYEVQIDRGRPDQYPLELLKLNNHGEVLSYGYINYDLMRRIQQGRVYVWKDGIRTIINVPGHMDNRHDMGPIDINNNGDVLMTVSLRANKLAGTAQNLVVNKNGEVHNIIPPDWSSGDVWADAIDDNQNIYGYLRVGTVNGEVIPFSWKDGVYNYMNVTPPAPETPTYSVIEHHPDCANRQLAVEHDNEVYCIGDPAMDNRLAGANANGQLLIRSSLRRYPYPDILDFFIWSLDIRSPQNALTDIISSADAQLEISLEKQDLRRTRAYARTAIHKAQRNRPIRMCASIRQLSKVVRENVNNSSFSDITPSWIKLVDLLGSNCD